MEGNYSFYKKIVKDNVHLKKILSVWQFKGYKIVFSNGCFDILHRGHVEYLHSASKLGNKLILGLNTDNSISRIKGPSRPIVDQKSRAIVIAALEFIDLVVFFDDDTPYELIKSVQPDILVKGDDYRPDEIVGADIVKKKGGKIITAPLIKGFSTTQFIDKIKQQNI